MADEIEREATVEESPDSVAGGIRVETVDVPDDLARALEAARMRARPVQKR